MAEEMAGGVLEGTETIPSEVGMGTPDAMAVDDAKADGVTEPDVLQPEVVDEKPVPGTVFLSSFGMPALILEGRAVQMQISVIQIIFSVS